MSLEKEIFKKGGTTYYWSSKFFPKKVREDVFKLYSYVRVMDNFVDDVPAHPEKLESAEKLRKSLMSRHSREGGNPENQNHGSQIESGMTDWGALNDVEIKVVQNIVELTKKYQFKEEWLRAFYKSMKWDADGHEYRTLDDTIEYIYGSAEVVGLMMSKILGLKNEAMQAARMQGRAMQFINFLRDIEEDNGLGRLYFPTEDLIKFRLKDLSKKTVLSNKEKFKEFMQFELNRYEKWQNEAYKGFKYIPKRYRIAIATAVDGYNWTAEQIKADPQSVFKGKVKPSKKQLVFWAVKNK